MSFTRERSLQIESTACVGCHVRVSDSSCLICLISICNLFRNSTCRRLWDIHQDGSVREPREVGQDACKGEFGTAPAVVGLGSARKGSAIIAISGSLPGENLASRISLAPSRIMSVSHTVKLFPIIRLPLNLHGILLVCPSRSPVNKAIMYAVVFWLLTSSSSSEPTDALVDTTFSIRC